MGSPTRIAIVTDAASGIGLATASRLLLGGASALLADLEHDTRRPRARNATPRSAPAGSPPPYVMWPTRPQSRQTGLVAHPRSRSAGRVLLPRHERAAVLVDGERLVRL